jgi:hypothetical protein
MPVEDPPIELEPSAPTTIVAIMLTPGSLLLIKNVSPYLYRKAHDH